MIEKIRQLNEIAAQRGQTLAEMALAWLMRGDRVTSVLVGASRVSQLLDNLKCIEKLEFSADELEAIEKVLNA